MTTSQIDHAKVAEAAFLLWLDEGRPEGRADAHWHQAMDALSAPAPKTARTAKAKAAPKPKAAARPKAPAKAKAAAPAEAPAKPRARKNATAK